MKFCSLNSTRFIVGVFFLISSTTAISGTNQKKGPEFDFSSVTASADGSDVYVLSNKVTHKGEKWFHAPLITRLKPKKVGNEVVLEKEKTIEFSVEGWAHIEGVELHRAQNGDLYLAGEVDSIEMDDSFALESENEIKLAYFIAKFTPDLQLVKSFGKKGCRIFKYPKSLGDRAISIAMRPDDAVIAAMAPVDADARARVRLVAFDAQGSPKNDFGDSGLAVLNLERFFPGIDYFGFQDIVFDEYNRVLLSFFIHSSATEHNQFALIRTDSSGKKAEVIVSKEIETNDEKPHPFSSAILLGGQTLVMGFETGKEKTLLKEYELPGPVEDFVFGQKIVDATMMLDAQGGYDSMRAIGDAEALLLGKSHARSKDLKLAGFKANGDQIFSYVLPKFFGRRATSVCRDFFR